MATASPASHKRGDSKDIEDFYREVSDIEQGAENTDDEELEPSKTPDEGEHEIEWLKEAGLNNLASQIQAGQELPDDIVLNETNSLTRAQAEAVKKRVATLNATLRNKKKPLHIDIRDVFGKQDTDEPLSPTGAMASHNGAKPHRKPSEKRLLPNRHSSYYMTGDITIGAPTSRGVEIVSIQSKRQLSGARLSPEEDRQDASPDSPVINQDTLGVTRIEHLSPSDLEKLRTLALLEVTSVFDDHSITFPARQKPRKRYKESGVFGVPLQSLLDYDQRKHPELKVPRFFAQLIQFLEREGVQEEGILRVPGSLQRIKQLRQDVDDKFNADKFSWEDIRPNDAAGLLKQFLRDLPIPLLTFQYIDAFVKVEELKDKSLQIRALSLLVLLLPCVHREALQVLLHFLKKVVEREDNKMTMINVSMIIAPNLFLVSPGSRKKAKSNKTPELEIMLATSTASIVRLLIENMDTIWMVDPAMLVQVRHKYEMEQQKKASKESKSIMNRLWRSKEKSEMKKQQKQNQIDFQKGLIKVQAPHLLEEPVPYELQPQTTAGDIVAEFHKRTVQNNTAITNGRRRSDGDDLDNDSKSSPRIRNKLKRQQRSPGTKPCSLAELEGLYLAEVGGNIGERKLDEKTNMLALLKVNPNADWVIKFSRGRCDSV